MYSTHKHFGFDLNCFILQKKNVGKVRIWRLTIQGKGESKSNFVCDEN